MNREYKSMNITTLRKLCASRKFKYAYQMTKSNAIAALEKNDQDPLYVDDPETTKAYRERHRVNQRKWVLANREKNLKYQKHYNALRRAVSVI